MEVRSTGRIDSKTGERPQTALRVELIPARPAPDVIAREIGRAGVSAGRRGAASSHP